MLIWVIIILYIFGFRIHLWLIVITLSRCIPLDMIIGITGVRWNNFIIICRAQDWIRRINFLNLFDFNFSFFGDSKEDFQLRVFLMRFYRILFRIWVSNRLIFTLLNVLNLIRNLLCRMRLSLIMIIFSIIIA
jgi:hypothetical protein